jgi:poly-beta-1,6-N-acetyl-D-glucosamine N-deacetylase
MQGIEKLNVDDKAMVMVTLNNRQLKGSKQWQQLQHDLLRLQSMGVQKLGISEYSLINAKNIHKYLYQPLSLNPNPLLYRDPFQIELKQGAKP